MRGCAVLQGGGGGSRVKGGSYGRGYIIGMNNLGRIESLGGSSSSFVFVWLGLQYIKKNSTVFFLAV